MEGLFGVTVGEPKLDMTTGIRLELVCLGNLEMTNIWALKHLKRGFTKYCYKQLYKQHRIW